MLVLKSAPDSLFLATSPQTYQESVPSENWHNRTEASPVHRELKIMLALLTSGIYNGTGALKLSRYRIQAAPFYSII